MKKKILRLCAALLIIGLGYWAWHRYVSTTRVALVNFQPYQASNMQLSNTDKFIKMDAVPLEELDRLKGYDFILIWGMGMKLNDAQHAQIARASMKVPTHTFMTTNPDNQFTTIDSLQLKKLSTYLESGNKKNYQNLMRYVRKYIDKKVLFAPEPEAAVARKENVYFHLDDEQSFADLASYEAYLKQKGFYKEGAPRIAMVAGIHEPFGGNKEHLNGVIKALQDKGMNVYPFTSFGKRIEFLEEIKPDAVVYFPHGQMMMGKPEVFIDWIKARNIPLFTPISILSLKDKWEEDPMGLVGGFMGQTVVMPELDGALYPYVVIAQSQNEKGYYYLDAIPNRAAKFAQIVRNFTDLKHKPNAEKKVAIVYYKGAGELPPVAQALEVYESLYNLLKHLKAEGYTVEGLPATVAEFKAQLVKQANVYRSSAKGDIAQFFVESNPALVESGQLNNWLKNTLPTKLYKEVLAKNGSVGDGYLGVRREGKEYLGVARAQFGNVVILPQPPAAISTDDDFKVQHGVKEIPPYAYMGTYLWVQNGFKADALVHFGTHGSLEFTPQKQVALSDYDWGDICVGTVPHLYYYCIGNIGESIMAKRRSYGEILSYLTPPFTESEMRNTFRGLEDEFRAYEKATNEVDKQAIGLHIKKIAVQMGLHRDLRLDSVLTKPYKPEDLERLENFAEELATEKINGQLYTTGEVFAPEKVKSTVEAMSVDPIAYSVAALDKLNGKITDKEIKKKVYFTQHYLTPAKALVQQLFAGKAVNDALVCSVAKITQKDLDWARTEQEDANPMAAMMKKMMGSGNRDQGSEVRGQKPAMSGEKPAANSMPPQASSLKPDASKKKPDAVGKPTQLKKRKTDVNEYGVRAALTEQQKKAIAMEKAAKEKARAILDVETAIKNVAFYREALGGSPQAELKAFINGLNGGYTAPSSGGDAVANPKAVPTGRNLYAINAEATPTKLAWDRGVALAQSTIAEYQKQHGTYPKKIAYTFWSSEFVETEGVSIAQVLYMLGAEPVWDTFGRVGDVRIIPSEELGRPRIDVVVQTSGQFRDLAASRLFLITKAIELVSALPEEKYANEVSAGTVDIEKELVAAGISPKEARELSTHRIFGGVNGNYGTNIQEYINRGDKWDTTADIAKVYLNNMGAYYGSEKDWQQFQEGLFRAAIKNTDVLIHARQNNTWGALSLDHVFEFMGGMNAAIKDVTGKDPDAYLADYRNHKNMHMQELKEAIGVEARTTILNPKYIKEMMKGNSNSAGQIAEIVTNMHGWEATRPEVIDDALWNEVYDTYIKDKQGLGVKAFIERENAGALEETTAVMLEAARKGLWKASAEQVSTLAEVHTDLVKKIGIASSQFSSENVKLQEYIAQKASPENAAAYKQQLVSAKEGKGQPADAKNAKHLQKEETSTAQEKKKVSFNGLWIGLGGLVVFIALVVFIRKRRK